MGPCFFELLYFIVYGQQALFCFTTFFRLAFLWKKFCTESSPLQELVSHSTQAIIDCTEVLEKRPSALSAPEGNIQVRCSKQETLQRSKYMLSEQFEDWKTYPYWTELYLFLWNPSWLCVHIREIFHCLKWQLSYDFHKQNSWHKV